MTEDKIIEAESHYHGKVYLVSSVEDPRWFKDCDGNLYFSMKKESEGLYRPDSIFFEVNGDRKFIYADPYKCLTDNGRL